MATAQDSINLFRLYVDDLTELSSSEELALYNRIYRKVLETCDFEFLKKEWSDTTDGSATLALPTDFGHLLETDNYTENNMDIHATMKPVSVYVNNDPYKVVNWSDRRQYENNTNTCYIDYRNSNLVFTYAPGSGLSVSADYVYIPDDVSLNGSPVWPARFSFIHYGMAVDDMICQLFDKARSYARENTIKYEEGLNNLISYNSKLYNG